MSSGGGFRGRGSSDQGYRGSAWRGNNSRQSQGDSGSYGRPRSQDNQGDSGSYSSQGQRSTYYNSSQPHGQNTQGSYGSTNHSSTVLPISNEMPKVFSVDDDDEWDDTPPVEASFTSYSQPSGTYNNKKQWDTPQQSYSNSNRSNNSSGGYQSRNDNWNSRQEDSRRSNPRENRSSYDFNNTAKPDDFYAPPDYASIDFIKLNKEAEEYRREQLAKMAPLIKNLYIEDPSVANMSPNLVNTIRMEKNNIMVSLPELDVHSKEPKEAVQIPNPVTTFEQCFKPYPEILNEIKKQKFTDPSPIQCQLWPCILKGLDVVGIAQTGSGKTLAFLLPALLHIEKQTTPIEQRNSPTVLVLAPTRELAQQIEQEVRKYSYKGFRSVCIYGGGDRKEQIAALKQRLEIVIATPGRLNDLVAAGHLNLKEVSFLVLDEADEMLNQGFEPQINRALLSVRGDRQTCLTSATWPESVRRMAKNYTKSPILVVVGSLDLTTVNTVTQHIVFVDEQEKLQWVQDFVESHKDAKIIIFVGKKAMADHMSSEFCLSGITCQCIHGDLSQEDREQALADMKDDTCRVLIGTDVAARGIDISDITHVVNYDVPRTSEQYVHRVGRTGRAGRTGEAWTVMCRHDWASAKDLIEVLQRSDQEVPQELQDMAERFKNRRPRMDGGRGGRGRGGFGRNRW